MQSIRRGIITEILMTTLSKTACSTCLCLTLCFTAAAADPVEVAPGVLQVGTIEGADISESSGLVASRRFAGTYWTHNDRGNDPVLFAINRQGETLGEFRVTGAEIRDWEDIDVDGGGNLYIADIGNNDGSRDELAVYKVREPNPRRPATDAIVRRSWTLRFPDEPFDSEAFFVSGGFGYLIAKELNDDGAGLYRFPLGSRGGKTVTLEKVGDLAVTAPVTGADLSRNARHLAVITGAGAYVFSARRKVLTAAETTVSFTPFANDSMEGAAFVGDGLLVSSETGELYLFNEAPFRTR
jgi:hypothetical protein